jgi:hypothetical protein
MAAKALPDFQDFVKATNERVVTAPKDILSDAVNRTYTLADMVKGRGFDEVVQNGSKITDRVQLKTSTQFGFYGPNDQFTPVIEDVMSKIECQWRFAKDAWSWTDHEVKLNEGDRLIQFKSLRDSKRQAATISLWNGMEQALWATPDTTLMESASVAVGRPYSIRAFITEDGLAPSGFTTVMQVDPAIEQRWRNQVSNYAAASLDSTLVTAFEGMWRKVRFEKPSGMEEYWKDTKFNKQRIYTSLDGWTNYVRLTRGGNDNSVRQGRPDLGAFVEDPTFGGIPVKWIEALDAVGYAIGQPRYFFVNFEFLFPVFHSERYMWETDPIHGGHTQPYSWVVYKDCWYNLFCRSRYRQGILVPV